MLYTGKGDKGKTVLFGCCKEFPKDSPRVEALGALDELNSFLGICKVKANEKGFPLGEWVAKLIEDIQNDLFVVQSELGGNKKSLDKKRVKKIEKLINDIEKKLPKIKSFIISGGTELSALLDYARAVARRAERRVVAVKKDKASAESLKYLNRLSSLLFALARLCNANNGIKESKPKY